MERLRYLTAGESHGRGLVGILEGMPSNVPLGQQKIDAQLARRQQGHGRGGRQKIEQDRAEVVSGVRFGLTLGSPIALLVWNKDWANWQQVMDPFERPQHYQRVSVPRPGHADLAGALKYRFEDIRNVLERSSARETTMRVALASIARQLLEHFNIHIASHVVAMLDVQAQVDPEAFEDLVALNQQADASPVRCLDPQAEAQMVERIDQARKEGNAVGGLFEVVATGVPLGLGSYVHWEHKLDARIARAMLSIQAMKSVEIGMGREVGLRWGSEVHDEIFYSRQEGFTRNHNHAGGIEGGMSTGDPLVVRVAMKPLSTLMRPLKSVDLFSKEPVEGHRERSDVCAVPAAAVIGESILALTLADALLEKFGGDSLEELEAHVKWAEEHAL